MNVWTIQKRITTGFAILIMLTAIIGTVGIFSLVSVDRRMEELMKNDMPGALIMFGIKDNLSQGYGYVERYLRAIDPAVKLDTEERYENLYQENVALYGQYKAKINTQEDQAMFDKMMTMAQEYGVVRKEAFRISRSGDIPKANAYMAEVFLPEYRNYRTMIEDYVNWNTANSTSTGSLAGQQVKAGVYIISLSLAFAMLLAIGSAIIIITKTNKILRSAIASLDQGSREVSSASSEVSSASNTLAQGASEQAASLEETSSSIEELASMTANNADNARQAKTLADEMRADADGSASQMQEMQKAMDAIKDSSVGISQIIKTIDEIAFQTNILALNAAVEAARAGESGAGFAIVAGEVRNLAQRSANSAKETSAKIEGAMRNSERGVLLSSKVASSLGAIIEKTRHMNTIVTEIATASQEQSKGISQLSQAVSEIDKVTQSNASSAEETAAASQQLNANAGTLQETVGELISLVQKSVESSKLAASKQHSLIGMGHEEIEQPRRQLTGSTNRQPERSVVIHNRMFKK